jgi:hypothetical protein
MSEERFALGKRNGFATLSLAKDHFERRTPGAQAEGRQP